MAPSLAFDILRGTSCIDCFIRGIFSDVQKDVQRNSQLIRICTNAVKRRGSPPHQKVGNSTNHADTTINQSRKTWSCPNSASNCTEILPTTPRISDDNISRPFYNNTEEVIRHPPLEYRPFCRYGRLTTTNLLHFRKKFSRKMVGFPKHLRITKTAEPTTVTIFICKEPRRGSRLGTTEEHDHVLPIPEKIDTCRTPTADEIAASVRIREKLEITNDATPRYLKD